MKSILLLSLVATLLFGGCASNRSETEVVVPPHKDTVVRDEIPAEGQRKIPVIQQY
jgi:hypothetical protein